MGKIVLSVLLTLVIMHAGAFLAYGVFAAVAGLEPPAGVTPATFWLSVLITKLGHALAFVLLFYLARHSLSGQWLRYAFLWWLMFVLGEMGEAIGPRYSWDYAVPGIIAETIYFPLSAFVTNRLIGVKN